MKLIIAGSRTISLDVEELDDLIKNNLNLSELTQIVSGGAKGMDTAGEKWARKNDIEIKQFIPDWAIGKFAGHQRNRQMGDYADAALVVYDGVSKGSQGMIDYMKKINKPCYVVIIKNS